MSELFAKLPPANMAGRRIDTVGDVLADLEQRFPKDAATVKAWADSHFRNIGHLPPEALRKTYYATLDNWEYGRPPKPADFKKNIPAASTASETKQSKDMQDRMARATRMKTLVRDATERYAKGNGPSFRLAASHVIEKRALEAVSGKPWPLPDQIELSGADLEDIEARAACLATSTPRDNTVQTVGRTWKPSAEREARRTEQLQRLAALHHLEEGDHLSQSESSLLEPEHHDDGPPL